MGLLDIFQTAEDCAQYFLSYPPTRFNEKEGLYECPLTHKQMDVLWKLGTKSKGECKVDGKICNWFVKLKKDKSEYMLYARPIAEKKIEQPSLFDDLISKAQKCDLEGNYRLADKIDRMIKICQTNHWEMDDPSKIKKIISDWYKIENRLMLAKQNNLPNTINIENIFKQQSRKVADLLIWAAQSWINRGLEELQERMEDDPDDETTREIMDTYNTTKWIIDKMSAPYPTQGDISMALQAAHFNGRILDYALMDDDDDYELVYDFDKFLSNLSNNPNVMPEAEKEANHDVVNFAYPKEEHSPEWRGAKKKKLGKH